MRRKTENAAEQEDRGVELMQYTVLSPLAIALWAVLIVAAGIGMAVWLLLAYSNGDDPRVQLDAIRTAGTLVVGAGGAAALLLAARRQRSTEIALKQKDRDQADVARAHALQERVAAETRVHQERVAAASEHDAAQRRVTDLYTKAADQLGSDKAPVRLAGVYALERLAQDNPDQRRTIVNVLSAYLRMPYSLPVDLPDDPVIPPDTVAQHRERVQEREVRLTAQRMLAAHLRPGTTPAASADNFWADTDLDLAGAVLINFDLDNCHLRSAQFTDAKFVGDVSFFQAKFARDSWFTRAEFAGRTSFVAAEFTGSVWLDGATFAGNSRFIRARFLNGATFEMSRFVAGAEFDGARFRAGAWFDGARFGKEARFNGAEFAGAGFVRAEFAGEASFDSTRFALRARFDEAQFASEAWFGEAGAPSETSFLGGSSFKAVVFAREVPPAVRRFWSPARSKQEGELSDPAGGEPDGQPG